MIGSTGRSLKEKESKGKDQGDSFQLQVGALITCRPLRGKRSTLVLLCFILTSNLTSGEILLVVYAKDGRVKTGV